MALSASSKRPREWCTSPMVTRAALTPSWSSNSRNSSRACAAHSSAQAMSPRSTARNAVPASDHASPSRSLLCRRSCSARMYSRVDWTKSPIRRYASARLTDTQPSACRSPVSSAAASASCWLRTQIVHGLRFSQVVRQRHRELPRRPAGSVFQPELDHRHEVGQLGFAQRSAARRRGLRTPVPSRATARDRGSARRRGTGPARARRHTPGAGRAAGTDQGRRSARDGRRRAGPASSARRPAAARPAPRPRRRRVTASGSASARSSPITRRIKAIESVGVIGPRVTRSASVCTAMLDSRSPGSSPRRRSPARPAAAAGPGRRRCPAPPTTSGPRPATGTAPSSAPSCSGCRRPARRARRGNSSSATRGSTGVSSQARASSGDGGRPFSTLLR